MISTYMISYRIRSGEESHNGCCEGSKHQDDGNRDILRGGGRGEGWGREE